MSEICIGTCSICGGDVYRHSGSYFGYPIARCHSCGAEEDTNPPADTHRIIPMKEPFTKKKYTLWAEEQKENK